MSWNQLTFDVQDDLKDAVVGEISDCGVAGVWESDGAPSGLTRLLLYLDSRANLEEIEGRIRTIFTRSLCDKPVILRSVVEERDWTEEWKKSYTSFPIGATFFVIPSWGHGECPHDRLPIRIDPGQAFGTGTHETTQLTIEALERWIESHHVVLDVGTGSGILAIASRILGARAVFACDIDPIAAHVAKGNISRNAEAGVWTFCGSLEAAKSGSVQLLLGNLTADLIVSLFPEVDRVLQPHGLAIFSGILYQQREEVGEIIHRFGFVIHEELSRGEWLALVTEKHVP
jgi:ribosomal protein L11 methyltransferase